MAKKRLTKNQQRRIKSNQECDSSTYGMPQKGLVVSHYGKNVDVQDEFEKIINCNLRQNLPTIAVGDEVIFESTADHAISIVTRLLPRTSLLTRNNPNKAQEKPIAANLDQMFIVFAIEPKPQSYLIDQFLIMAEMNGLTPILILNKYDLLQNLPNSEKQQFSELLAVYQSIGYETLTLSHVSHSIDLNLKNLLRDKSSIFVGQSGVGKSTITQSLIPDVTVLTGAISSKAALGKHTTSVAKLYFISDLSHNSKLIDAPGIREMGVVHLNKQELERSYVEFRPYLGKCKFKDCEHIKEPDCALKAALQDNKISQTRWQNFRKFAEGIHHS